MFKGVRPVALFEVRHVTISFGGLVALHELDMKVEDGEIVGIIGPNGAGKTTLFNVVSGFNKPNSGEILMSGKNVLKLQQHEVAEAGIGRTFQNVDLFKHLTVRENLLIGQHRTMDSGFIGAVLRTKRYKDEEKRIQQRAEEICRYLGVREIMDMLVIELPLGTQKMVELGRALVSDHKLLLLDEPVAGMSPPEVKHLSEVIRHIRGELKITVLLIEHHMGLVMTICDRIYVLNFGKKIAEGTPEQVRNNENVIHAYLGRRDSGAIKT